MKRLVLVCVSLLIFTFSMTGCASMPVTRVDVQSFELRKGGVTVQAAVTKMTGILIDRGFDVKMSSTESGIVTTEYKKFASIATDPPFDYYMQIRSRVRLVGDMATISLIPAVKEQNRLNVAAFTEHELTYFTGDPESVGEIVSMQGGGWRTLAQVTFMNVVTDAAEAFDLSTDDVIQNVSKAEVDAGDVEN